MAGKGRRLAPEERAAVLADIKAHYGTTECAVRRVANRCGVSTATVRRIATSEGIELGSDESRAKTKDATKSNQALMAEKRQELAARLLVVAEQALDDISGPGLTFGFGGKDYEFNSQVLDKLPSADKRNLMTVAAIGIDKHLVLVRADSDASKATAFDMWIAAMGGEDE